jgi:cellobiose-specific phosphotransferase system component IIA
MAKSYRIPQQTPEAEALAEEIVNVLLKSGKSLNTVLAALDATEEKLYEKAKPTII